MTAPEVGEATGRDDASTISASEVAQLETRRQPPGTINPSAEEAHINAGNLEVMKAHVSYHRVMPFIIIIPKFQYTFCTALPKATVP